MYGYDAVGRGDRREGRRGVQAVPADLAQAQAAQAHRRPGPGAPPGPPGRPPARGDAWPPARTTTRRARCRSSPCSRPTPPSSTGCCAAGVADVLVTDLPYGVAHGSYDDHGGISRRPLDLLERAVPQWLPLVRPGGALGLSWNIKVARRELAEDILLANGLEIVAAAAAGAPRRPGHRARRPDRPETRLSLSHRGGTLLADVYRDRSVRPAAARRLAVAEAEAFLRPPDHRDAAEVRGQRRRGGLPRPARPGPDRRGRGGAPSRPRPARSSTPARTRWPAVPRSSCCRSSAASTATTTDRSASTSAGRDVRRQRRLGRLHQLGGGGTDPRDHSRRWAICRTRPRRVGTRSA